DAPTQGPSKRPIGNPKSPIRYPNQTAIRTAGPQLLTGNLSLFHHWDSADWIRFGFGVSDCRFLPRGSSTGYPGRGGAGTCSSTGGRASRHQTGEPAGGRARQPVDYGLRPGPAPG